MSETEHHGEHGGHDDHGHGHGSRFIQHHYDDAQHQFDAGKLGIWLFLVQEVLFFSGLFVATSCTGRTTPTSSSTRTTTSRSTGAASTPAS